MTDFKSNYKLCCSSKTQICCPETPGLYDLHAMKKSLVLDMNSKIKTLFRFIDSEKKKWKVISL